MCVYIDDSVIIYHSQNVEQTQHYVFFTIYLHIYMYVHVIEIYAKYIYISLKNIRCSIIVIFMKLININCELTLPLLHGPMLLNYIVNFASITWAYVFQLFC